MPSWLKSPEAMEASRTLPTGKLKGEGFSVTGIGEGAIGAAARPPAPSPKKTVRVPSIKPSAFSTRGLPVPITTSSFPSPSKSVRMTDSPAVFKKSFRVGNPPLPSPRRMEMPLVTMSGIPSPFMSPTAIAPDVPIFPKGAGVEAIFTGMTACGEKVPSAWPNATTTSFRVGTLVVTGLVK